MRKWTFISPTKIVHADGHEIQLEEGTWLDPVEIKPSINWVDVLETARLLRQGLEWAANQKNHRPSTVALNTPDRAKLSLKSTAEHKK